MQIAKLQRNIQKHFFLILSVIYFLFRLTNLTLLPIFNDEAIYLDWGWRMTHEPGYLYYSLFDSKQPLLMWLFGIAESIFSDPLFAGRFVSVLFGFLTMVGIYRIGRTYFDRRIAILSSLLYIVIPLFSFFDRQALMEAAVSTIGVWSVWYLVRLVDQKMTRDAVKLGIVLGIGFFIKTTALLFFVSVIILLLLIARKRHLRVKRIGIVIGSFLLSILFLLINPEFWQSLSSNDRYGFTVGELIRFPILSWTSNFLADLEIMFVLLTPFAFVSALVGIYWLFRKGDVWQKLLLFFFLISLLLQILLVRDVIPRYVVSFLPLLTLLSSIAIVHFLKKRFVAAIVLLVIFFLPVHLTLMQLFYPPNYFLLLANVSRFSDIGYVRGSISGYGMTELRSYIASLQQNEGKPIFVGIALNAGIPESALNTYYQKSDVVAVSYLDGSTFSVSLDGYDCFIADVPLYFVSRRNETAGIGKFLTHITDITNSYNDSVFGIWTLKTECEGESLPLSFQKT